MGCIDLKSVVTGGRAGVVVLEEEGSVMLWLRELRQSSDELDSVDSGEGLCRGTASCK